jgi:perosamine synthetase
MLPSQTSAQGIVDTVSKVLGPQSAVLHEPEFAGRELEYVSDCVTSGWVSSVGAYVDRFELMLAEAAEVKHAVATVNGTAALHVALLLAGVKPGDEVLIPTLTFIATANAVAYAGATPHFVDSETATLGVDADALNDHLRETAELRDGVCRNRVTGAVIRALMPMHTFGLPADMDRLDDLAERWSLTLVEDAAEAIGSRYRGRACGSFGRLSALSFNGNKIVTTGGGGAILTNDADLARRAKHLTTTARVPHKWSFIHDEIGFNYRMPNINAALGCAQLEQLDSFLRRKRTLAGAYIDAFRESGVARIAEEEPHARANYWLVALLLDKPDEVLRDSTLDALNGAGFGARPVWTLMHRLPMYADCPHMAAPMAESLAARIINLPSSPKLAAGLA